MPDPNNYDDKDEFMKACMSETKDEGLDHEQSVGKCLGMWRGAKGRVD